LTNPVKRYAILGALGLAALVLAGMWGNQYGEYAAERRRLRSCLEQAQQDLLKARAAERKKDQFLAMLNDLNHEIGLVRREIMPESLDADRCLQYVKARASSFGVEVEENQFRQNTDTRPQEGEMFLLLHGPDPAIRDFLEKVPGWGRIAKWKTLEKSPGMARGTLTIYAYPPPTTKANPSLRIMGDPGASEPCPRPGRKPWLQPYAGTIRAQAAELETLQRELAAHEEVLLAIRQYELRKAELLELIDLINSVKKAQMRELTPVPPAETSTK
jgi:hypothetical protein